jgi:hypothetical protein
LLDGQARHFFSQPDFVTDGFADTDIFLGKSRHQHFAEGSALVIVDDVNSAVPGLHAVGAGDVLTFVDH